MQILDNLTAASKNKEDLGIFVENNIDELYDFLFSNNYAELSACKSRLEEYISRNLKVVRELDFNKESTKIFLNLLLDVSERLGFLMPFEQLYKLLRKNNIELSSRLEASSKYLIGIRTISDYENAIEPLLDKLALAFLNQEDSEERVVSTLLIFYAQVVHNFGQYNLEAVQLIRRTLIHKLESPTFGFGNNTLLNNLLSQDVVDYMATFATVHSRLDAFLLEEKKKRYEESELLIEQDTRYSIKLNRTHKLFSALWNFCFQEYLKIPNRDDYFYSLGRGVSIIKREEELLAYMVAFGQMHYHKLMYVFRKLPENVYSNPANIIDWGCGQGLGTIAYLERLQELNKVQAINKCILVEPSIFALKRAALHVQHFGATFIQTINRDLDAIDLVKTRINNGATNIHLFSNILDVTAFSLADLFEKITAKFKGVNYFVCVSPILYDVLRDERIGRFANQFKKKYPKTFESVIEESNGAFEWRSDKVCTMSIKVFKVVIN